MKAQLEQWSNNISFKEIQQKFGSPLWVVSEQQLVDNINLLSTFCGKKENILFPVKANPSLAVLEILAQNGLGADCSSKHEVDLALYAGIPFAHIAYNSPIQDVALCYHLLKNGAKVVMDDPEAIMDLQGRIGQKQLSGKLWLRINPEISGEYAEKADYQDLTAHGAHSSKFGIPVEDLEDLLPQITIPISGLHLHVGTQMDNLDSFIMAMENLHKTATMLKIMGNPVTDINIGGGLGIPFTEQDQFPSLRNWAQTLIPYKQDCFDYFIEPGHALVGNTVGLLMTAQSVKLSRGRKWVLTDAGTDQVVKITLLKWRHQILGPDKQPLAAKGNDALAGPLCFAGDTLLPETDMQHIQKGDPIFIQHTGAYTYSLSNKFNGRYAPGWVVIDQHGVPVLKTLEEKEFEDIGLTNYLWKPADEGFVPADMAAEKLQRLSSKYLKDIITHDNFEYTYFRRIAPRSYQVSVKVISDVSFISIPFSIRVIGDAAIVALLDLENKDEKDISVWGRRVQLDFMKIIPTNKPFVFQLDFSEVVHRMGEPTTCVIRYKTLCNKLSGTIVATK